MAWQAPFLEEFKKWYVDLEGFGTYLRHFLAHYGHFFRSQETHLFIYTKLHKEFVDNLERAILEFARDTGDVEAAGIVDAMTQMLEYHSWIEYIYGLKASPEVQALLEEQWHQPGWDQLGDSELRWQVKRWEQWSQEEWDQWYQDQDDWAYSWWDDKYDQWTDKTWGGYGGQAGYA
ncbi:unnamed protein product [Effrenium voratum]|nr:unnamed protein product [Effrenium voratum]